MATPTNDTYTRLTSGPVSGGRYPESGAASGNAAAAAALAVGKIFAGAAAGLAVAAGAAAHGVPLGGAAAGLAAASGNLSTEASGSAIASLYLTTSAATGTYPFSIAMPFREGDAQSGNIACDLSNYSVTVLRTWNDGSVKHALITGRAALTQNVARTVNISVGASPGGTALTAADIQTAAPSASIQCGAIGTVNLSSLLASPVRTWISSPEMVEGHYRADIGSTQMSAWFHVRLFADGRVWVRAICENGYLDNGSGAVASLSTQTYVPTIVIGGTTVYSNGGASLSHYAHTRYSAEGWIGGDPQVTPLHDVAYVRATKLVPNYGWTSPQSSVLNGLVQTYTPMNRGPHTQNMGDTGFQAAIGLIPNWEALYFSTGDARAYRAVLAGSSSLNTYAICRRGKNSQRPIKITDFTTWNVGGPAAGGSETHGAGGNNWEVNHHPEGGYSAYLLTGDYWHYETMLFNAELCWLCPDNGAYGSGTSRLLRRQIRGSAWMLRTVGQLCAIAPSSDIGSGNLVEDYRTLLANNYASALTYIRANYTQNVSLNGSSHAVGSKAALGMVDAAFLGDWGIGTTSPWMMCFWLQANGMISDAQPLAETALRTLNTVRDYMYRFVVMLLGPAGDVNEHGFINAGTYPLVVAASNTNNETNFYQNWGRVYEATNGTPNNSATNTLLGTSGSDPANMATGYWGNLHPAIAYAVEHRAIGADAAWARLTGATNYAAGAATFNDNPVFGVSPRSGLPALPAWVSALSLWTWYQIPNTRLDSVNPVMSPSLPGTPASKTYAWNGATLKRSGSVYLIANAGGHDDYAGNEVTGLTLNTATPGWTLLRGPSIHDALIGNSATFYLDNRPSSTHTYNASQFWERGNRITLMPNAGWTGTGFPRQAGSGAYVGYAYQGNRGLVATYNMAGGDWEIPEYFTEMSFQLSADATGCFVCKHQVLEDTYYARGSGSGRWSRFRPDANTWEDLGGTPRTTWYANAAMDPLRNRVFSSGHYDGSSNGDSAPVLRRLSDGATLSSAVSGVTFSGLHDDLRLGAYSGAVYDEANDRFLVFYNAGTMAVRRVHPTTGVVDAPSMTGSVPDRQNGISNSIQYVPELRGVVICVSTSTNVWFMRTAA